MSRQIVDRAGLLCFAGTRNCLGSLMDFGPPHGVHDASLGRVDVTSEAAQKHNTLLDQALLTGLDTTCQVGQGNTFYLTQDATTKQWRVTTFTGLLVSDDVTVTGKTARFARGARQFSCRIKKDADCVHVQRIA